jgi:hypothetical protein
LPNIPSTNIPGQTRRKSIWSKTKALCCLKWKGNQENMKIQ